MRQFDWGNGLGVNLSQTPYSYDTAQGEAAARAQLAAIASKGFDWVRIQITQFTHDLNGIPDVVAGDWSTMWKGDAIDKMFATLGDYGLRAVVVCSGVQWRRDPAISYSESDLFSMPGEGSPAWDRFGRFFGKIARHVDPNGDKHVWECWNEPNLADFAFPAPDRDAYLYALWRFGDALKNATSTVDRPEGVYVLGMSTSKIPQDWFDALAGHPAAQVVDAVGPHPYTTDENGALGWGSGPQGGPTTGPSSQNPDPNRGKPANAVAPLLNVRATLRRAGRNRSPIEVVSGEWGAAEPFVPVVPTNAAVPAYTSTFGAGQLLKSTSDWASGWQLSGTAITYGGKSGRKLGAQRQMLSNLGHWTGLIHAIPNADAATSWPANKWYGFRFWARSSTSARIWVGQYHCKTGFELTPEWKEYRGAYNPGGAHWYADTGTSYVFVLAAQLAGGEFEVAGLQAWMLTDQQVQAGKDEQGAVVAREIVKAVRASRCPLHIHYRWDDLPLAEKGLIEGRYGLTRENGTEKPALAALLSEWGAA